MEEEKLIKQIKTEQKFADVAHKSFRESKYGITSCCPFDLDNIAIKKYLCNWQLLKNNVPAAIISLSSEIFEPSGPIDPCTDTNAPYWCVECGYVEPPNAEKLLNELKELQNKLIDLESEISVLTLNLEEKNKELEVFIQLQNELQAQQDALQTELNVLQQSQAILVEQYNNLNCEEDPKNPACQALMVQIKDLDAQIQALTDQLKDIQSEIKKINESINNLQLDIQEIINNLAELNATLSTVLLQIQLIEEQFCDDSECIIIEVLDTNGNPVSNYPLVINGGNVGVTDIDGMLVYSIPNASIETNHTLQICYCFTTEGNCRQQHITITVQADDCAPTCTKPTPVCTDVIISETIIGIMKAPTGKPPRA
tara:strand:- start:18563 stop:19669 length:1107 start_codon:yes stop_codon:yes gene_type:complete